MATSITDGPLHVSGSMQGLPAATFGSGGVPDPNQDAGPSIIYQGMAIPDPRLVYLKDKVTGFTGTVQAMMEAINLKSIGQIPCALSATNISAAANVVSGTAVTLAAGSLGITKAVPIVPFGASLNSAAVATANIALDFGFAFGSCTAGSATITVANSADFIVGMPLVIGAVGNSGGTIPLLTQVVSLASATTITVSASAVPLATNATAPIGTGNLWGPSQNGFPVPTAAFPFIAGGPGLFLDPRQAVTRGIVITGATSGTGGDFTVRGWDLYNQPMTETVAVGAGAVAGYSLRCYKYLQSVTPAFTDAHNYSVGTSDLFGFALRSGEWEDAEVCWAAASMTASTGWVKFVGTTPSLVTGDVRGTIQTGAAGPVSGIGANASNGSVSALAMSGRRLNIVQRINPAAMLMAGPASAITLFGQTQYTA